MSKHYILQLIASKLDAHMSYVGLNPTRTRKLYPREGKGV